VFGDPRYVFSPSAVDLSNFPVVIPVYPNRAPPGALGPLQSSAPRAPNRPSSLASVALLTVAALATVWCAGAALRPNARRAGRHHAEGHVQGRLPHRRRPQRPPTAGTDAQATALIAREFNCGHDGRERDEVGLARTEAPTSSTSSRRTSFVDYCRRHGLVVIGHNLCWQRPAPLVGPANPSPARKSSPAGPARAAQEPRPDRRPPFPGQGARWDVVNEAIKDGDGQYRESVFLRVLARSISRSPSSGRTRPIPAELYYNDYNLDADDAKARHRDRARQNTIRAQGAPIHGIGLQGHYNLTTPTAAKIDETIQLFADLGLKVMITELDVEAIRDTKITGAIDATTGAPRPMPRRRRARASSPRSRP